MSEAAYPVPAVEPKLRWWPALVVLIVEWLIIKVPGWIPSEDPMLKFKGMMFGPMIGAALLLIWWLFFSRVWVADRWLILAACLAIGGAAFSLYDKSLGFFGGVLLSALPAVTTAWLVWLLVTPRLRLQTRYAGLMVMFIGAWGYFAVLRFDGVDGGFNSTISYRWQ